MERRGGALAPLTDEVRALVADLGDASAHTREQARAQLVRIGRPAVGPLAEALRSPAHHVRWEAAKALAAIADPDAAPALVAALHDDEFDVRWLAGNGLIAIGRPALEPLLAELMAHRASAHLREGAHHVLHDLARDEALRPRLAPVLAALESVEPEAAVPSAAAKAMHALRAG